jgi:predicted deacetylase
MRPDRVAQLRQETVEMFYHGYDNYMNIAFPEDEVRCTESHTARLRSMLLR